MVRECVALSILTLSPACSLLLDFDAPVDAAIDGLSTQAECDFKEPNDTSATAMVLAASETGPAAICAAPMGGEDKDFYKVTTTNATVTFGITFTNRPGGDLDLRLWDGAGTTMLAQSRGLGDGELITCPGTSPACPSLPPADYILEVFPAVAGALNAYTIQITP